jgi:hypothetical protein
LGIKLQDLSGTFILENISTRPEGMKILILVQTTLPTVSGRDRGIPKLRTKANTLIRPAHKQGGQTLQQQLDVEQQQGQRQR